jgi:hypothetical protein
MIGTQMHFRAHVEFMELVMPLWSNIVSKTCNGFQYAYIHDFADSQIAVNVSNSSTLQ